MLKALRCSHQRTPRYVRTYGINKHALSTINIFTASEEKMAPHDKTSLFEDLYHRNTFTEQLLAEQLSLLQETDGLLKKQVTIISTHTYNEEPLDKAQLIVLEAQIRTNFRRLADSANYCKDIVSIEEPKGPAQH